MGTINVVATKRIVDDFIRTQRFRHHERPVVGTADTDVHHVGDGLTGVAPFH